MTVTICAARRSLLGRWSREQRLHRGRCRRRLLGTVRRTGTRAGSLTTSPPLNGSRSRKYARTIIVVGVGEGVGGAIVGLGVAGVSVGDARRRRRRSDCGRLRRRRPSATGGWPWACPRPRGSDWRQARRRLRREQGSGARRRRDGGTCEVLPTGIHPPSASTGDASPACAGSHEVSGRPAQIRTPTRRLTRALEGRLTTSAWVVWPTGMADHG